MMNSKKNAWYLFFFLIRTNDDCVLLPPIKEAIIQVEAHVNYGIFWIVQKLWIPLITNDFPVPAFQSMYCIIWAFELWNAYLTISIACHFFRHEFDDKLIYRKHSGVMIETGSSSIWFISSSNVIILFNEP